MIADGFLTYQGDRPCGYPAVLDAPRRLSRPGAMVGLGVESEGRRATPNRTPLYLRKRSVDSTRSNVALYALTSLSGATAIA
jgi:hypothetical protein